MEVVEENPFKIENDVGKRPCPSNHKNSAGRPTKNNEIKFSQPPKSVISILLSNKNFINKEHEIATGAHFASKKDTKTTRDVMEGNNINLPGPQTLNIELQTDVYRCKHSTCNYSTKFPSNLKTHKRIHTNEQPYICDKCTFRTKFINSLKTHKRLHKDEKPFACKHCDYKCNSSSNLKKHISRKHITNKMAE